MELQQTFPKRSSSLLSETTRGAANRPQGNTSTVAPVTVFMITYSRLIPKHSDSPHHAMDFTTSRTGSSFTSVKSLLPEKMAHKVLRIKIRKKREQNPLLAATQFWSQSGHSTASSCHCWEDFSQQTQQEALHSCNNCSCQIPAFVKLICRCPILLEEGIDLLQCQ